MGKPYKAELEKLGAVINWAATVDVKELLTPLRNAARMPIAAVASGGSLSAVQFLALLHKHFRDRIVVPLTPLEVLLEGPPADASLWFLSASGNNVDIVSAFKKAVLTEPRHMAIVCANPNGRIVSEAEKWPFVDVATFKIPTGRDGFLATNSLLASCLVLAKAYFESDLPGSFPALRPENLLEFLNTRRENLRAKSEPLWKRETIVVLHGPNTRVGAVDMESRFTEAALGNVQIADYRNFAHGRHHWFAKRHTRSALIALISEDDEELAERTLGNLPSDILLLKIRLKGDWFQVALRSLLLSMYFALWAGEVVGIDPGRPGVPGFGRRLYHLPLGRMVRGKDPRTSDDVGAVAIERKARTNRHTVETSGALPYWTANLAKFRKKLNSAKIGGIIFDYDGTIVDTNARFQPPSSAMVAHINKLTANGLLVGIATGRGKSIQKDLIKSLKPESLDRVFIGYYNGAIIHCLADKLPKMDGKPAGELLKFSQAAEKNPTLAEAAELTVREHQITLESRGSLSEEHLWQRVNQAIVALGLKGLKVVRSSHSIDVLAPGITKVSLADFIKNRISDEARSTLKIGDRGCWPGNDFELLQEPLSLSVDETSANSETCWHLAPRGYRGTIATLFYLERLTINGKTSTARIRI